MHRNCNKIKHLHPKKMLCIRKQRSELGGENVQMLSEKNLYQTFMVVFGDGYIACSLANGCPVFCTAYELRLIC